MGIEIRPDYGKIYLLPPSLEDWIKAGVSKHSGWHKDDLQELLAAVETSIDQMMNHVSQAEQTELNRQKKYSRRIANSV